MNPLRITAKLRGAIALPERPLALDALLAYAVCVRDAIPMATVPSELVEVDIPVEKEPGGRFHLSTVGIYELDSAALRYVNKRAPVEQYQTIGSDKIKRVQITAGANKSYRIPMETLYLVDDTITWWCIGDENEIRSLLVLIHHLGKRRAVGLGQVARWDIEAMEPQQCWDGFPAVLDGMPLRNLPPDHPGVLPEAMRGYANITYPYWRRDTETLCAMPG